MREYVVTKNTLARKRFRNGGLDAMCYRCRMPFKEGEVIIRSKKSRGGRLIHKKCLEKMYNIVLLRQDKKMKEVSE